MHALVFLVSLHIFLCLNRHLHLCCFVLKHEYMRVRWKYSKSGTCLVVLLRMLYVVCFNQNDYEQTHRRLCASVTFVLHHYHIIKHAGSSRCSWIVVYFTSSNQKCCSAPWRQDTNISKVKFQNEALMI